MNKGAIKTFAVQARQDLIRKIKDKAFLIGIAEDTIQEPLPQSTKDIQFFDIGLKEPSSLSGNEIVQRNHLVDIIQSKAKETDYPTAYQQVIEEVAYTWFNRLIAIRFMEVNDYLPSRVRVLSSETKGKNEPDLVTTPFDADLSYTQTEKELILQMKNDNQLDKLFQFLFIKQCNALNENLPELFEKTSDYSELLINVSFTDPDGVIYHLTHDIDENDFNVEQEGQIEIIGWLYQYYNTEPKEETFTLLKKNVKITKERIPSATQLFTPDWIVRYMVENSLGRLWVEGHPNSHLQENWKYYLEEAEQESEVQEQLALIREEYKTIKPEDIKIIDPSMGSGHILVYAFDVLMQIYESCGYSQRDAAKSIVEHNLYGLDIDKRAYQLAYFAVMMKARQYNRRILTQQPSLHLFSITESNSINQDLLSYFGTGMAEEEKQTALEEIHQLLNEFQDASEYGSIIEVKAKNWSLLYHFVEQLNFSGQMTLEMTKLEEMQAQLCRLIQLGEAMSQQYDIVITNPPYMGSSGMSAKLSKYVKANYPDSKSDLFAVFIEKGNQMTKRNAYNCMVTMQSWMFLSSFEKMRTNIVNTKVISNLMHMDNMVMGIAFGTAVAIFRNCGLLNYKGTYNQVKYVDIENEKPKEFPVKENRFAQISAENFSKIPGMPIAYWVSEDLFKLFDNEKKLDDFAETRLGMATANNEKFLRFWSEIEWENIGFHIENRNQAIKCEKKWFPYNKGGEFRRWYGNNDIVVNWKEDGKDIRNYLDIKTGKIRSHNYNLDYIFRKSITWSFVSSSNFGTRYSPKGFLFDVGGSSMFLYDDDNFNYLLAFLSSKISMYILRALNPTLNFQPGNLSVLPIVFSKNLKKLIDTIVIQNIQISKTDWDFFEISWDFTTHPLLQCKNDNKIETAFINWEEFAEKQFYQLKENEEELNRIFIEIYGLEEELTPKVEEKDVTVRKADLQRDIRSFVSYAVGCMFGRYSPDIEGLAYAGGDWDDSLYNSFAPVEDNILLIPDTDSFSDDIVSRFVHFVSVVYGSDTLEENLAYITDGLGTKGLSSRDKIRNYFLKDFYKDHCKIYQKRPIYWLFDSGKENGFKALIYLHRYEENTIGKVRIDYLHRLQHHYENELSHIQDMIVKSSNVKEVAVAEKQKEKLIKQLKETKDYDEKIAHLALARISLDLDDGVKVNYEKVQTDAEGKKHAVLAKI